MATEHDRELAAFNAIAVTVPDGDSDGRTVTLGDLAAAAERVLAWPPERQEAGARCSALSVVASRPGATLGDVMREQGLDEEHGARALAQLVAMGRVRARRTGGYEVVAGGGAS